MTSLFNSLDVYGTSFILAKAVILEDVKLRQLITILARKEVKLMDRRILINEEK